MTTISSPPKAQPATTSLPPRRILAIWCVQLALDRWRHACGCNAREGPDSIAFALISETAYGPRIYAANMAARDEGARAGMMLADARTLCPALAVEPHDPAGDLAFLERFAIWTQRWGPWSALDAPDGVLVDIAAAAHLFGGEERLLTDVGKRCSKRGLQVHAAIAPTPGAAWALAHYGQDTPILNARDDATGCLSDLPVAALRLDEDILLVLRRLGLKRLGDLAAINEGQGGRGALRRRFRNHRSPAANPLMRMDQLTGLVPDPLLPVVPVHTPLVQRRLLEPILHRHLLDQIVADLAEDMARELEGRAQGARRLVLTMWRVDGDVVERQLELAAPTRDGAHITRLFASRLDDVDAGFGIEMVRLRAVWWEELALGQGAFETAAQQHGTSLAACVDRLTVRLGTKAVQRPVLHGSHLPERAQRWQAALEPEAPRQHQLAFHTRPLKLLDKAEKIAVLYASPDGDPRQFRWRGKVHDIARSEGPERIAPEWWRARGNARLRDYYRIEDKAGRRYWIYREGLADDGRGGMPDWFMHGLYA